MQHTPAPAPSTPSALALTVDDERLFYRDFLALMRDGRPMGRAFEVAASHARLRHIERTLDRIETLQRQRGDK